MAEKKKTTVNETVEEKVEETVNETIEKVVEEAIEEQAVREEIWKINWVPVYQAKPFIKTEVYHTPIPMYKLPVELQQYLRNMWFGTNVWKENKEWLDKHGADMKMIERLKKFISENFN